VTCSVYFPPVTLAVGTNLFATVAQFFFQQVHRGEHYNDLCVRSGSPVNIYTYCLCLSMIMWVTADASSSGPGSNLLTFYEPERYGSFDTVRALKLKQL
jgi:hypothetical protein